MPTLNKPAVAGAVLKTTLPSIHVNEAGIFTESVHLKLTHILKLQNLFKSYCDMKWGLENGWILQWGVV